MRKIVKIKPINFSVEELEISSVYVKLDNGANINCRLFSNEVSVYHMIELTPEEYEATILEWADFELEKADKEAERADIKASKIAAYQKMGLTQAEIDALMPPEPELLGSN